MAKTVLNLIMTFDGYVAGLHDEIDWIFAGNAAPAETQQSSDDATSEDPTKHDFSAFVAEVGAIIVGKRSYELGIELGWFKNETYGPSPIFVLCESAPKKPSSDADFRFVTEGLEAAYQQANEAAGEKIIYLFGGPSVFQQSFNKDLVDEMRITIAPIMIGKGIRLFDNLTERQVKLNKIKVTAHPNGMIETCYRIVK